MCFLTTTFRNAPAQPPCTFWTVPYPPEPRTEVYFRHGLRFRLNFKLSELVCHFDFGFTTVWGWLASLTDRLLAYVAGVNGERKVIPRRLCDPLPQYNFMGNPKTLSPGLRTPTTDRIRGLPSDRSMDYPYETPSTDHPQNSVKL